MSPPVLDPERERDRTSALRVAKIAAVALVIGSLLGGGGAIGTALISSSSEASQARDDHVRDEQQAIYTAVIAANTTLSELEEPCASTDDLQAALDALEDHGAAVELMGSFDAYFKYSNLVDAHKQVVEACSNGASSNDLRANVEVDADSFLAQARTDIKEGED
jgi:hypothetical protein